MGLLLLTGCGGGIGGIHSIPEPDRWTVTASSQQKGHPPTLAADGDNGTEWLAADSDPQPWLQVDLGRTVYVSGFSILWGAAPATDYTVSISPDGKHWALAWEVSDSDGGWDLAETLPARARYVRLAVARSDQTSPVSLRELEILGNWTRPAVSADGKSCPQGLAILGPTLPPRGWCAPGPAGTLSIDLRAVREIGGVRIDWGDAGWAAVTTAEGSADGENWKSIGTVRTTAGKPVTVMGNGLSARWVRLNFRGGSGSKGAFEVRHLALRGAEGTRSPWARLQHAAASAPPGCYPLALRNLQPHCVPAGTNGAALCEDGAFAGAPEQPALWPAVVAGGTIRTPATPGASPEYRLGGRSAGPLPELRWDAGDGLHVRQRAMARPDAPGAWQLIEIENRSGDTRTGWLHLILHPVTLVPPWAGGLLPCNDRVNFPAASSPRAPRSFVVNRTTLYTVRAEDAPLTVGTVTFDDSGDILRYLSEDALPTNTFTKSTAGLASALCGINYNLAPGARTRLLVWTGHAPADQTADAPFPPFDAAWDAACWDWADRTRGLDPRIDRPDAMEALRAQTGWLLCPPPPTGSDPLSTLALRTAALLRAGAADAARAAVSAVAAAVDADGLPPAGLLPDGSPDPAADPLPPGEAEGQFAFMLLETLRFTGDTAFLTDHYPTLLRTLQRLSRLREDERRRALRASGFFARTRKALPLGPADGPHEGLLPPDPATGRHPYAALLWALTAWREGTAAAGLLGHNEDAAWMDGEYRQLRDSLRTSLRASIDSMPAPGIPESPENPVSSLRAARLLSWPCNDPGLAEPWEIQTSLDEYYAAFLDRIDTPDNSPSPATDPLVAIPYARLGRGDYAREILADRLEHRAPPAWHAWPALVPADPQLKTDALPFPSPLAAAAYHIAVRSLLADERGPALHLLEGPFMEWLQYGDGLRVEDMPTAFGPIDLTAFWQEERFTVTLSGDARPPAGYRVHWPLTGLPERVTLNGVPWTDYDSTACNLPHDFSGTLEATLPYLAPWPREP